MRRRRRRTVPAEFAPEWTADRFAETLINANRSMICRHVIQRPPYVDGKCWTLLISAKQWKFLRALQLRGHSGYSSYYRNWVELEGTLPSSGYQWSLTTDYIGGTKEPVLRIDEPGGFSTDVDPKWQRIADEQGCTIGDLYQRIVKGERF